MTRLGPLLALVLLACTSRAFLTAPQADLSYTHKGSRKSLGFGPHHSHQELVKNDNYNPSASTLTTASKDTIFDSAITLAKEVTGGQSQFFIRSDSYTDPSSGLTFVFVKQTVNGLLVEDGDMNAVYASDGELFHMHKSGRTKD